MNKFKRLNVRLTECDDCAYYDYFPSHGYDCSHPDSPELDAKERDEEPLAENRIGNFPLWCPLEDD